jgi:hypothetical protein
VTKASLQPVQRRVVELIEALDFGVIEHLRVRRGKPCFDPQPRIIQSIKLDSAKADRPAGDPNLTLKSEFASLFDRLTSIEEGVVTVEVRHGAPFRLVIEQHLDSWPS